MMKRFCLILAALVLLGAGCASAEQRVQLPESRYAVTLPDGMTYDGPGEKGEAAFAYVSEALGLDVSFTVGYAGGLQQISDLIPAIEQKGMTDVRMTLVNGIEMLVYRYEPEDTNSMKCIGYILRDGDKVEQIEFWYAGQGAADLTRTIMESIGDTGAL